MRASISRGTSVVGFLDCDHLLHRASALGLGVLETGETIEVTDRGRPVAVLAPLPDRGTLEQLRATGDVTAAASSIDDLPQPLDTPKNLPTASQVLGRLRRDER